ncbi:hypothetical protein PR003_g35079, partial [Phytophthora rubi]
TLQSSEVVGLPEQSPREPMLVVSRHAAGGYGRLEISVRTCEAPAQQGVEATKFVGAGLSWGRAACRSGGRRRRHQSLLGSAGRKDGMRE